MGDAGVMGGAAANNMTLTGVQTSTGAKTFNNQKLLLRNPADTFSLTMTNPAITSNQDSRVNTPYSYLIFKDGSTYYAKNGATTAIDYSSASADALLTSIVNAISPAGTPTIIELAAGDFNMAATFSAIIGTRIGNITIRGQGPGITNLVLQTSITGSGRGIDIAGSLGTGKVLTANLTAGQNVLTVSTTDSATFAQFDYVLIRSTRDWDTSAAASADGRQGEIHRVKAVNTGTGVITLYDSAFDSYATSDSSDIVKITMLRNIILEGFTIKPVSAAYAGTGAYLRFYMVDNLQLNNVEMQDNVGEASSGIRCESIINSELNVILKQTGLVPFLVSPDTGQYGIWLGCASQQVKVNLKSTGPFRHPLTTGGIAGAATAGVARGITVSGTVSGTKSVGFDTHRDTDGITFINCIVNGQSDGIDDAAAGNRVTGIAVRAKNVLITGCNISRCRTGITYGEESDAVTITGNYIHDCYSHTDATYGYGIRAESSAIGRGKNGVISGNRITNCGNNAIWGEGANDGTVITGNHIEASKVVKFTDSANCIMVGNRIINGANAGLQMTGTSTGWTIIGNDTTGSASNTIVGTNIIRNNTGITDTPYTLTSPTITQTDTSKTANYTLVTTDYMVRADASGGAFTLTLPTAVGVTGKEYLITRTDIISSGNMLTVATTSSQTIGGAPAQYLQPGEFLKVESDGANWVLISRSEPGQVGYYFLKNSTFNRRYAAAGGFINGTFSTSTTSPAADTLWALPFVVGKTTKFDTVSFNLTTGAATNARLGIYRDNGNCYPGARIFDSGDIDCTSSGVKDITITAGLQVFPAGLYWLAWVVAAATIQIRILGGASTLMPMLGHSSSEGANAANYGYSVAHSFGPLPDPYTAAASLLSNNPSASAPVPALYLRAI